MVYFFQEDLGISDEEFDDLQSLFEVGFLSKYSFLTVTIQLFDRDKDGILTAKELQLILRCLGFRPSFEQVN